jgi:hypothetical protein
MKIIILITVIMSIVIVFPSLADEANKERNWGIGLQANYPLWGGISVRYYGLSPIYFQAVGRSIWNGNDKDNMIGSGISYAVFEHKGRAITRLYISLEGGLRYEKFPNWIWLPEEQISHETITKKTTYGSGLTFGIEIAFNVFGTQIGFNTEFGQGFGKIEENQNSRTTASFLFGAGGHIYF